MSILKAHIVNIFNPLDTYGYEAIIRDFLPGRRLADWTMLEAMACGNLSVIKLLHHKGISFNSTDANVAAKHGHLHVLQYLQQHGVVCTAWGVNQDGMYTNANRELVSFLHAQGHTPGINGCREVVRSGDLTFVQWVEQLLDNPALICNTTNLLLAVEINSKPLVEYMCRKITVRNSLVVAMAAKCGNLPMIKYLFEEQHFYIDDRQRTIFTEMTARGGFKDATLYFLQGKFKPSPKAIQHIVRNGWLDVYQRLTQLGLVATSTDADAAAENGQLNMLEELFDEGVSCTIAGITDAVANGHLAIVEFLMHRRYTFSRFAVDAAAGNGHLDMVKFCLRIGKPFTTDAFLLAARHNRLEMLQSLVALVADPQNQTMLFDVDVNNANTQLGILEAGVTSGDLTTVVYICESIINWQKISERPTPIANKAAEIGNLALVEYLETLGFQCDVDGCNGAAAHGHLRVIKHLNRQNIRCNTTGMEEAILNNQIDVVRLLYAQKIPFDVEKCLQPLLLKQHCNMIEELEHLLGVFIGR